MATPDAAWAMSYARTWFVSGPPAAASRRTAVLTTLPASSMVSAAPARSGAAIVADGAFVSSTVMTATIPVRLVAAHLAQLRATSGWHDVVVAAICVFCGSSAGHDRVFAETARALGAALAGAGHGLVYGGGHVGLMGVVADAVLAGGGDVTGVMTEQLVAAEVVHRGLTTLEITASMHERKARMATLSDGVIVLPGGFGTLDETFEIITWNQLGLVAMPVVFLDVGGYFTSLFDFLESAVGAGFVSASNATIAQRAGSVDQALELALGASVPYEPKWIGSAGARSDPEAPFAGGTDMAPR